MAWGHCKSLRLWHDLGSVESIGLALASGTNALPLSKRLYGDTRGCMPAGWILSAGLSMVLSCVVCRMLPSVFNFTSVHDSTKKRFCCAMLWLNSNVWTTCNTLKQIESSRVKLTCRVMSPSVNICQYTVIHPRTLENVPYSSKAIAGSAWVWICRWIWGRMQRIRWQQSDKGEKIVTSWSLWLLCKVPKCQKHDMGIKVAIGRRTFQWP